MSLYHGQAAMNLQFTDRVPRTEYSVEYHRELISAVTGIKVDFGSPQSVYGEAVRKFKELWRYDFTWNVLVSDNYLHGPKSSMGHAVYAADESDYNPVLYEAYKNVEDIYNLDMYEVYGKVDHSKMVEEFNRNYRACVAGNPDTVNMTGVYISCISGFIAMFGWEMLLTALGEDPVRFGELTNRYEDWIGQHFRALADCEAPYIMIHDDMVWTEGAFAHPDWYRKYIFPNFKKNFAPILEAGKKIIFTADGTYTEFIDDIADCGAGGFVIEPTTDMKYIADKYGKTHVFVGNADTRILLHGTKEDIYNEVKRCMDTGKSCPGFFMAVGNHIPANTPVESCLWYNEFYEKLGRR